MYKDSMELLIQKYLRSGGTLQELNQVHEIASNVNNELGIVVFNYRNFADLRDPMVLETRGLILELDTWNVVYKPLTGFLTLNQVGEDKVSEYLDWSSTYATEKLDGALLGMYYYKDAWRVCTRLSTVGDWLVWSMNSQPHSISWAEYAAKALEDMGTSWDEFTSKLNKDISYTFEIVGPENRVLVVYDARALYLIGAFERDTLQELDIYAMSFPKLKPKRTKVKSIKEALALANKVAEPYLNEGVVLVDGNFKRMKVINQNYVDTGAVSLRTTTPLGAIKQIQMSTLTQDSQTTIGTKTLITCTFSAFMDANQINQFTSLFRFAQESYFGTDPIKKTLLQSIWPTMFDKLETGMSMSEALVTIDGEDILKAFAEYSAYLVQEAAKTV